MSKRELTVAVVLAFLCVSHALTTEHANTEETEQEQPLAFSGVVEVDGVDANRLYVRARLWFAETFVDSTNVLEIEDKEAGMLVGKGTIPFEPRVMNASALVRGQVRFNCKILVRDGRYRYSFSEFTHYGSRSASSGYGPIDFGLITTATLCPKIKGTTRGMRQKTWSHLAELAEEKALDMIATLKEMMETPVDGGDDDW